MVPPPRMLLLGAGLSGGLLALALAELGVEVELAGGSLADSATGWSYGRAGNALVVDTRALRERRETVTISSTPVGACG